MCESVAEKYGLYLLEYYYVCRTFLCVLTHTWRIKWYEKLKFCYKFINIWSHGIHNRFYVITIPFFSRICHNSQTVQPMWILFLPRRLWMLTIISFFFFFFLLIGKKKTQRIVKGLSYLLELQSNYKGAQ